VLASEPAIFINMSSPASQPATATAAATTTTSTATASPDPAESKAQIAVLDRVIAKDHISKINFPDLDEDFNKFEDTVHTELVSRQLEWLMSERLDPHAVIVQKILRAKLLNSISEAEKRHHISTSTFTEVFLAMKKDATTRDASKVDIAVGELFYLSQPEGQDLLSFVKSRQDLYARIQHANYPLEEKVAVHMMLRKFRQEYMTFVHACLHGPVPTVIFNTLVHSVEQLNTSAEPAHSTSISTSALQAQVRMLQAQLAHQHSLPSAKANSQDSKCYSSNRLRKCRAELETSRRNGETPPRPCSTCGGDHWERDCPQRNRQTGTQHQCPGPSSGPHVVATSNSVTVQLQAMWIASTSVTSASPICKLNVIELNCCAIECFTTG
jgi:hypothetical protein